ncbi:gene transfer agent family protein [Roseibium sp. RKSG952]|uniref:gene transfer agent family protein n=1 Tax=Roseibium sp. RKSG952 TaxID=2529384 RepID=UPI0012BD7884|nr:gene transfer agent family protein [Roseibium sp. RKSG952]MTH95851.1 gene transfer agent family protein [Roseibium sp. RKSG952]
MANRLRGEISAMLDGRRWTLVLTLGALAELEDAFACEDINALVERFATGRLSARDMTRVIGAGLRGAGNAVTDEQVAEMTAPAGIAGFAAIVADLLKATFGDPEPEEAGGQEPKALVPA